MILTATINEVKRRVTFDNPNAVVAVKGDYEVNGVAFAFPAIYEDDFDLSTAVKTVYYKATDGIIYNHVVTDTDTDTGYPLWVFKDEINKGAYGDVEFALVCDKVENGNIVKRWVSMITAFRVQKSIEIDEAAQEDNEQTYSERLAYLMTQMANMQATVSGLASGAPTPVGLASAMTDTSKLYVYTGSESGYTAGHWYYYNGSAWADGGQYGGISVDPTLTVSGAAADAKVVGDEIVQVKEDLSAFIKSEQLTLQWGNIGTTTYPLGWRKGYYSGSTGAFSTSEHYISTIAYESATIKNLLRNTDKITVIPPDGYTLTITAFDAPYSATSHNIVFRTDTTARMDIAVNHNYYYVFTIGRFDDSAASYITDAFVNSIVVQYVERNTNVSPLSTFNVGMFSKIGVCGYSWDAGYYYTPDGSVHTNRAKSWGAILARKWGIDYGCYTVPSGTTVKPDSDYSAISWQGNSNGLPALLADSACDLYFMHMFGNDLNKLGTGYLGTIDDITADYSNNPDTYYGNMGRIIEQIKTHSPNALIVLSYNYYDLSGYDEYCRALLTIAEHYGLPVIDWYQDEWYATQMDKFLINKHPTLASYSAMAETAGRLIANCIKENWDYFKAFDA